MMRVAFLKYYFLVCFFQLACPCQLGQGGIEFLAQGIEEAKEEEPAIPKWPEKIQERCRTIKTLAAGPYKGKEAKIMRSGWALWGIDSIGARNVKVGTIKAAGPAIWKFYIEASIPTMCSHLYYGRIDGSELGSTIPACWLSGEDTQNLFEFHRYELAVFGDQLFTDPQISKLFKNTIHEHLFGLDGFMVAAFFSALQSSQGKEIMDYIRDMTSDFVLEAPRLNQEFIRMREEMGMPQEKRTYEQKRKTERERPLFKKLQHVILERELIGYKYEGKSDDYLYVLPRDLRQLVLTFATFEKPAENPK